DPAPPTNVYFAAGAARQGADLDLQRFLLYAALKEGQTRTIGGHIPVLGSARSPHRAGPQELAAFTFRGVERVEHPLLQASFSHHAQVRRACATDIPDALDLSERLRRTTRESYTHDPARRVV